MSEEAKKDVAQVEEPKMHVLGVLGTGRPNEKSGQIEYATLLVTEDIIGWLNNHDVEFDDARRKIYVVNKVKYLYLGEAKKKPQARKRELEQEALPSAEEVAEAIEKTEA